jgi:hypothetical protein
MGRSACWSYVTWHHRCSSSDWATWEPGEVVDLGDVGRFNADRRFLLELKAIGDPGLRGILDAEGPGKVIAVLRRV